MFDRKLLLGFAAGLVIGALGFKFYTTHEDEIKDRLKDAGLKLGVGGEEEEPAETEQASAAANEDLTLEELMSQKERLDDLIAEYQARNS